MNISALLYFLFVYIVYKTNNFDVINKNSTCGGTNDCLKRIKACDSNYKRKFSVYSGCVNKAIFGRNFDFPDKDKYMNQMYSASTSKSSVAKNMRKVYFQIILSILKSSGYNEEYEGLFQDVMNSIIIDYQNLDFDLSKVQDKTYNEIAEKVYFNDLVNKYNFDFFDRKKFYNKENSETNDAFLNELNAKYLQNSIDTKYVKYILENLHNYNIEPILLSNPNINSTSISEFHKNFLMDYNDYYDINDMIEYIEEDQTSKYNLFDFIYEICIILNKDFNIKYIYNENDKKMTSSLDFSSLYENVNTISELIYNLIFDYYNYIYTIYVDKDYKDSYSVLHYFDEDYLYFTIKFGNTLDALMDSDFYKSIYYPIISFSKKFKDNKYISECLSLVEQLYKFTNGNYELKEIKKAKFTIKKDLDYKSYLDEFYDIKFMENSFLNLIENKETDIYEDELRNYIHELCLKYNKMGDSYSNYALSALNLENEYNSINDDNMIQLTYILNKNEEEIYESWYNQNIELVDDDKSSDYVVSEIMNIIKSNEAYSMIDEYLLDNYNNSTLRKRQNKESSPEQYDPATQGLVKDIVIQKITSDEFIQIHITNDDSAYDTYYKVFFSNEKKYREEYKHMISSMEKLYFSNSELENGIIKSAPELASLSFKALQDYISAAVAKKAASPIEKLYRAAKASVKRKHFGLALKDLGNYDQFNKYNKWNKFNNNHELAFLNVMRNYNQGKETEDRFTFKSDDGEPKFNIDVTDDPAESYKKKKQYIDDIKTIYGRVLAKKKIDDPKNAAKWEEDHPLNELIRNLVISSENEYCYSNTNIHDLATQDLDDIPENLFEKPSIYEGYGKFIDHIYKRYIPDSENSQASTLEKQRAAECLLKAVKNINDFDYTKKIFSLTKLSEKDKLDGSLALTKILRSEEKKLDNISEFIKKYAVRDTENGKKQIKEIDAAMKKLGYAYERAPRPDNNNNNNNNGGNNEGNNGGNNGGNNDGNNGGNNGGNNEGNNDGNNGGNNDGNNEGNNDGNDSGNNNSNNNHTKTHSRKGKRSYPKTMFKRKF